MSTSVTFNWFAFITVVLVIIYYFLHPLITAKLKTIHNTELQQALKITDQLATFIIPELAVMSGLSKPERKTAALQFVTSKLNERGITLQESVVSAAIETAYQVYKHVIEGDQHVTTKSTSTTQL